MLLTLLLLLLLLSSSCQLSFYTCSLQFRKTFRLFFSSPTILSCSSCLLTTSQLSTAVSNYSSDENALLFFILCFLSLSLYLFSQKKRKRTSHHVRMQQISCTEEKEKKTTTIWQNFCHRFLALYAGLDCTIFSLFPAVVAAVSSFPSMRDGNMQDDRTPIWTYFLPHTMVHGGFSSSCSFLPSSTIHNLFYDYFFDTFLPYQHT